MNLRVPVAVTLLTIQLFKLFFTVKASYSYTDIGLTPFAKHDKTIEKLNFLDISSTHNQKFVKKNDPRAKIDSYMKGLLEKSFELRARKSQNLPLNAIPLITTTPSVSINTTKSIIPNNKNTSKLITRFLNSSIMRVNKLTTKIYEAIGKNRPLNQSEMSRERLCAYNLKNADGQQWSCKVQFSREVG